MRITTREYEIDRGTHARAMMRRYFRKKRGDYIFFPVCAGIVFVLDPSSFASAFLASLLTWILVIEPLYSIWTIRSFVRHRGNDSLYQQRSYSFDDGFLLCSLTDGTDFRTPLSSLVRAEIHRDHWILYTSQDLTHFIPKDVFQTDSDRTAAMEMIQDSTEILDLA